ncbi:MAG: lysine transporter LysE [Verrucomicrobia bacterium]|nr:lysine transporter LysE [Verrucomicrobiota bacterium]
MDFRIASELAGIFLMAFVVGLSGAMMPGTLLVVTITESSRRGGIAGPMIVLGHAVLEGLLVVAVAFGLAGFLTSPWVKIAVGLAGGIVMCLMGADMVRSARIISLDVASGGGRRMHPVLAGVVVSLSNPYWTIWWATVGLAYLMVGVQLGVAGILTFFVGHILADLAWYSLVSYGTASGRKFLPDNVYRRLILACGLAVVAFGVLFIWTGVEGLSG